MAIRDELLYATDETIEDAVTYADPMTLRGLVYQLTGDESLVDVEIGTARVMWFEVPAMSDPSVIATVRSKAAEFLRSYRDQGAGDISIGPRDRLPRSMGLAVGGEVPSPEMEIWLETLCLDPYGRGLVWSEQPSQESLDDFSVAVLGAGMGGLNAAVQLKHAGIPFTVLEKNSQVGGTWYENRYPGARLDSPSRGYTHSYGVEYPYPYPFSPQAENEKYFNWVADRFDVRKDIEFDTEVKSIIWDDETKTWEIKAEHPDGSRQYRVNAVISCVGFLAQPNLPNFEGLDEFGGRAFHSARWPADLDLSGQRVAVVGSACTAYQMMPELAKEAGHVYLFQRTPNWCIEVPGYLDPHPPQVNWLDRNFPFLPNFQRFRQTFSFRADLGGKAWEIDPNFDDPHARSAINKTIRDQRVEFLQKKFADHPDLFEKMLPVAPPFSSRPVLVDPNDGVYDTLLRDNVSLVTDGIARITREGIESQDGTISPVDVIVLATGFRANDFLWPMVVQGRGGLRIEDLWSKDGARAYIGVMLPGFPNFFMNFGPNSSPLVSSMQVADMEEVATRFALGCMAHLITQNKRAVDVTLDAYWRFNGVLDREGELKLWNDPRAHNYFINEHGRSAANNTIDGRIRWEWLRDPSGARATVVADRIADRFLGTFEAVKPYFGEDLVVE
ncbi:MAG: 4-hydroxyacetophenone monooxygenase [Mycobacterium sp.]|nr:4-hydroxyacetophenone monooxygenase [Mycobacterium sp.]